MNRLMKLLTRLVWQEGTCNDRVARRNRLTGEVQFVIWKAGEQGHTADCWHKFDQTWWSRFKAKKGGEK